VGHRCRVITIQRVRVRWSAAGRGAPSANTRRGLDGAAALPTPLPPDDVVVHEVLATEADGYARHDEVLAGGLEQAREVGLWITFYGAELIVDRLPGRAAYPHRRTSARLFTLGAGQVGRYRANFRLTGCSCNPSWYYENWLIHISNGTTSPDRFTHGRPDRDVDDRVTLYGGTPQHSGRQHR
jgi:hypothetical protein